MSSTRIEHEQKVIARVTASRQKGRPYRHIAAQTAGASTLYISYEGEIYSELQKLRMGG